MCVFQKMFRFPITLRRVNGGFFRQGVVFDVMWRLTLLQEDSEIHYLE